MKKIFYSLALFLSIFIINISAVDAARTAYYKNDVTDFVIQTFDSTESVSILSDIKINGDKHKANDFWQDQTWIVTKEKSYKMPSPKKEEYKVDYNYIYYNQRTGSDHFWLSDLSFNELSEADKNKVDLVGESVYYSPSTNNAILNEMLCTYDSDKTTNTISFRIKDNGDGTGSYILYKNFKEVYSSNYNYTALSASSSQYIDHFDIRSFWNSDTKSYLCPSSILLGESTKMITGPTGTFSDSTYEIGYSDEGLSKDEYRFGDYDGGTHVTLGGATFESKNVLSLAKSASYIDYEEQDSKKSQICNYTYETEKCNTSDCNSETNWYIALMEKHYSNSSNFIVLANETLLSENKNKFSLSNRQVKIDGIESGTIDTDCSNLPVLYTKCLTTTGDCIVTTYEVFGYEKLVEQSWRNNRDSRDVEQAMGQYNGYKYRKLMCELKGNLLQFATYSNLMKTSNLLFYTTDSQLDGEFNINSLPCSDWGFDSSCVTEECKNNSEYYVNKSLKDIYSYCSSTYSNYYSRKSTSSSTLNSGRYEECKSFETFYDSLVENGIISNMFTGCDVYTGELAEKINFFLNIIKIAAPIMAIVLGMLDFGKAVVASDSAKEMKDAGKRFGRRLIATALLFLVPTLLSVLINIFLGDEINNNPYCGLLDIDNNTTEITTDSSSNIIYNKEDCPGLYIKSTKTCVVSVSVKD